MTIYEFIDKILQGDFKGIGFWDVFGALYLIFVVGFIAYAIIYAIVYVIRFKIAEIADWWRNL